MGGIRAHFRQPYTLECQLDLVVGRVITLGGLFGEESMIPDTAVVSYGVLEKTDLCTSGRISWMNPFIDSG